METVKRERECMDVEIGNAWMANGDRKEGGSAWMETVKRERECMDGDSEEREEVHGWRQ